MSSYMHFFVRKNENFLPIACYSRSSAIYGAFSDFAPYEKVRPLTSGFVSEVLHEQTENLSKWKKRLEDSRKEMELIATFNNSVEDKMQAIYDARGSIEETEEIIEECEYTVAFCRFLLNILDEADSSKYYEDEKLHLDAAHYLYYGVECGDDITSEMIEE